MIVLKKEKEEQLLGLYIIVEENEQYKHSGHYAALRAINHCLS